MINIAHVGWIVPEGENMNSSIHRALVFQGGGSLGAYGAGAYKDINEELSRYLKAEGRGNEPIFHIESGTSIGAINAAILVSYVKNFQSLAQIVVANQLMQLL
jgi:predicted acylesterase/phospholipase RssA